jgi:hypothetical protein
MGACVTSKDIEAAAEPSPLRIFLRYEYLSVSEVSDLLTAVGRVYDELFWAELPAMIGTPRRPRNQLRVHRIETGNSILIELQALGQMIESMDPTLTGIAGGAVVVGLAARVLIHALKTGHVELSAAKRRNLELEDQRLALEERRARTSLELERTEVDLAIARNDAEFRNYVQSVIRATTSVDFAAMAARQEPLTDSLGAALLGVYSVLDHDNITEAQINDVEVKPGDSD